MKSAEEDLGPWGAFFRSNRSTAVVALVGGAVLALICWYFGVDVWQAITFGAVAGTFLLFYATLPDLRTVNWRDVRHARAGARHEVSSLAYSLRPRYGRVGDRAMQVVRDLAGARLALRHLDLTQPDDQSEIERLIGRHTYAVLRPGRRRRPTYRGFLNCLDALDGLDSAEDTR